MKIELWANAIPPRHAAQIVSMIEEGVISRATARDVLDHFHSEHLKRMAIAKAVEPHLEGVEIIWKHLR